MYARVREIRHGENRNIQNQELREIFEQLKTAHPEDWLLPLEVLEISQDVALSKEIRQYLTDMYKQHPHLTKLIQDGLGLIPDGLLV